MRRRCLLFVALAFVMGAEAVPSFATGEVKLRNWYLGIQTVSGERDEFDVFAKPDLPPGVVESVGPGGGFVFGRRFGDRFLLGLQMVLTTHQIDGYEGDLLAGEALVTGTVLFNEREVVQPFVRGGVGGGMAVLEQPDLDGNVVSLGPAAIVAAGVQFRVSSRVSFELEGAGNVTNFLEVNDDATGDSWQVRTSHVGWRVGMGLYLWF
ncbi:MAG: hypothetical protein GY838_03230 [bacterium]|nr:hypothetical protein [bacterium]